MSGSPRLKTCVKASLLPVPSADTSIRIRSEFQVNSKTSGGR